MTIIGVSAQFGGLDGAQVILPHFRALQRALENRSFAGFPLPELHFILRVDGQLQAFGPSGADNIKFGRKRRWVSVDIVITTAEWEGRDTSEISAFVAGAIMASVDLVKERGRLKEVDWRALEIALETFSAAYREECGMIVSEQTTG